jgi:hypothetical protein
MIVQHNPIYLPYTEIKKYRTIFKDYGYTVTNDYSSGRKLEFWFYDKRLYATIEHLSIGFAINVVPLIFNRKKRLEIVKYQIRIEYGGTELMCGVYYHDFVENEKDLRTKLERQIEMVKKEKQYIELEKIENDS